MRDNDQEAELERYLRRFQLRAVRPLETPCRTETLWGRRQMAAAAVVLVAVGIVILRAPRELRPPAELDGARNVRIVVVSVPRAHSLYPGASPALTKLALDDGKAFDALLTDKSRDLFPNMQGEQSALRVLARNEE